MKAEKQKKAFKVFYLIIIGVLVWSGLLIAWVESMLGVSMVILGIAVAVEFWYKMQQYDRKIAYERFKERKK